MDSVEESLRGLLAHSVPRPGSEPDPATSAEFGQLLSQAALAGPDAPLDYRLAAPKWQFLCHAADHGAYVLHGSGTDDIAEFEPRQSNDIEEFGNRRAVYAASDGLWAMYFAIVDRGRYVTSLYNGCCRLGPAPDGPFAEPRYFFSVNEDASTTTRGAPGPYTCSPPTALPNNLPCGSETSGCGHSRWPAPPQSAPPPS